MNEDEDLKKTLVSLGEDVDSEMELIKLKQLLRLKFEEYQTTMKYMAADAPIQTLCLPKSIENFR